MQLTGTPINKILEQVETIDYDPIGFSSHIHLVIPKPNNEFDIFIPRKGDREIKLELFVPHQFKGKTKTIILFPGCTVQGFEMANVAERFVDQGFIVWVVDFSVGEIESHSSCHYTISQLVKDVKDVIDFVYNHAFVDKDNLFIAGHSFGAFSSLLYMARYNEQRVRAVIGICPVVDVVEVGLNHIRKVIHKSPRWERLLRVWMWKARRGLKNTAFFLWKLFGKLEIIIRNGKRVSLGREFLKDLIEHNSKETVMRELASIRTPCLLLHAENDPWVSLENVQEIYDAICSSVKNLCVLKGVDHLPMDEMGAERILSKTLPWLDNISGNIFREMPPIFSTS